MNHAETHSEDTTFAPMALLHALGLAFVSVDSTGAFLTPTHGAQFYAALRAIPSKLGGVVGMFALMVMPVLAICITKARDKAAKAFLAVLRVLSASSPVGLTFSGAHAAKDTVFVASCVLLTSRKTAAP